MKKAKMIGKKTLSVFLAVLMALTAWVWVAPTEASAAAGSYYVKITWQCTDAGDDYDIAYPGYADKADGNCVGISLYHKSNNGTGTESEKVFDLKTKMATKGSYTETGTITGFPTSMYVYNDHGGLTDAAVFKITKIEIGSSSSSTLTTLWSGEVYMNSTMNIKYVTLTSSGTASGSNDTNNAKVTTTSVNWVYPYASTFTWSNTPEAMTCPKSASSTTATQTVAVTAKDQYGVQMFDPTWSVKGSNKSDGITVSPTTSSGSTTIRVTSAANIAGTTNSQTGTVTATWSTPSSTGNTSKTSSKTFTINDATYTATFKNHRNANGVVQSDYTTTAQYGTTPTAPTASNYSVGDYDYTFISWSPTVSGLTADTTYTASYNSGVFVGANYTAVNNAIAAADAIKAQYGTEYEFKFTYATRTALDSAIDAVVTGLGRTQQTTVDGYAQAINDAIAALEPNKFDVIFLDKNGAILLYNKNAEYKTSVEAPAFPEDQKSYHDATNHYTYSGWDTDEYTSVLDDLVISPVYTAEAHNFKTETVTSTCVQAGTTKHTCQTCGYTYYDGGDQFGDHVWNADYTVDLEATCTVAGSKSIHCTLCDAQKDITAIAPLGHNFTSQSVAVEATCGKVGIMTKVCDDCLYCEHTIIPALEHDYKETVVAPTCTTKGYTEYICQRANCGHSYRDNYTDVVDHSYGAWETVSNAYCGVPGVKKQTCTECGHVNIGSIDALNHNLSDWTTVVDRTCTGKGYQVKTCSLCNNVIEEQWLDALGHNYVEKTVVAPTCTSKGYTIEECNRTNCGAQRIVNEKAALNHAWTSTRHEADCTHSAYIEHVCGNDSKHNYIEYVSGSAALTHDFTGKETIIKNATCESDGHKTVQCKNCTATTTVIIPLLGHTWGAWKVVTEATNSTDGEMTRTCSNGTCTETATIPMGGHEWDGGTVTETATCTKTGKMVYKCSKHANCGITIEVTVPMTQHTVATKENPAATCTTAGTVEAYCSVCNKVFSSTPTPVKAHNFVAQEAVAPTCTTAGYTPYKCSVCSFTYNVFDGAQATGHVSWTETGREAATCTDDGSVEYKCDKCDATKTEILPKTGHNYVEDTSAATGATCATPATKTYECNNAECGDSYTVIDGVQNDNHTWGGWQTVVNATNTSIGYETRTCTTCGKVEVKTIPATGEHVFDEATDNKQDATCTADGWVEYACSTHNNCGLTSKEKVPATGHTQEIVYTAPTCITAGSTKVVCSVESCKAEILSTSIPATSKHDFSGEGVITNPGCTTEGEITYTCATKDCTATKIDKIPAKGHTFTTTVTDAECGEKGSVVTECKVCNDPTVKNVIELTAKGHIWNATPESTVDAKCETDGSETYKCQNCNETNVVVLPKLGHDWGKWTVKQSTNDTAGSVSRTCSTCNKTETVEIPAGGHKLVEDTAKYEAPTCTVEGKKVYKCDAHTDCGITLEVAVPVAQHGSTVEEKKATCEEDGYIKTYCPVCKKEFSNEPTEKIAHVYKAGTAVAATCTTSGYTPYTCSGCNDTYNKYDETKPATGHDFDETIAANVTTVNATCTADGSKTVQCKNCDVKNTVVLPKTGHNYVEDTSAATSATCTALATKTYKCTCGASYVKHEGTLAAHQFNTLVKSVPATNESLGYEERQCVCGLTEITIIEATGTHVFDEKIENECIDPTCTENGTDVYKCTAHTTCGVKSSVLVPRLGHSGKVEYTAPTCIATGSSKVVCEICKDTLDSEEIPAKGHAYNTFSVTTKPGCESVGVRTYSCNCGDSYTETIPAKGHDLVTTVKDATCTAEGSVVTTCKNCTSYNETFTLTAKNHNWNDGVENPEATCTSEGKMTYTCTVENCGATKTEDTDALGHTWGDWTVTPSTNNGTGSVSRICSVCNEPESIVIPAGGHDLVETSRDAASCTKEGSVTYTCNVTHEGNVACGISVTVPLAKTQHVLETKTETEAACETEGKVVTKCTECNNTLVTTILPAKNHKITVTVTPATCTAEGSVVEKCANCEYSDTTTIAMLNHSFSGTETPVKDATCTADGEKTVQCINSGCTETTTVIIPKLGHTWKDWEVVKEATNTTEGEWKRTCSNDKCTETLKIPAGGHTWDNGTETLAPTCTTTGTMVYKCNNPAHTNCGITLEVTIPVTQHTVVQRINEASCTKTGSVEAYCSVCDEVFSEQEIPVKAHVYTAGTAVAPTCSTSGYTPYTCTCGDSYNKYDEKKPATGHTLTQGASSATCEKEGIITLTCANCDYTKNVNVPALGHNYQLHGTTDATCAAAATKTYKCTRCTASYTISDGDKTTEHTWGAWTVKESATASSLGYETRECTVCGKLEVRTIPATGEHNFSNEIGRKDATCTETGWIEYACSTHTGDDACGKTSKVEIPANGHTEKHEYQAATCTAEGYSRMICSVCDDVLSTETIVALGHDWNRGYVTNATCNTEGKIVRTCSRGCTETNITTIPVNPNAHQYKTTVVKATCTSAGSVVTECTLCKDTPVNETLAQLEHSWNDGEETTEATCTTEGVKTYTCSACKTTKTEDIPALGHAWGEWTVTKDSTNTAAGEMSRECERTDCNVTETVEIPAGGHNLVVSESKPASCTEEGSVTYACDTEHKGGVDCGITVTVTLDKLQHEFETTSKDATCDGKGEVVTKCKNCDTATYTTIIPATGCAWDEGVVTKEATCTTEGLMTYTCAHNADHKYTAKIAKVQHNYVAGTPVAPTCTSNGYTPYKCETCESSYVILGAAANGHTYVKDSSTADCENGGVMTLKCACGVTMETNVPALGHNYVKISSTDATCAAAATETYKCTRCEANYTVSVGGKLINDDAHDWNDWVTVEIPSYTSIGYQTRTCKICDKLEVGILNATGDHDLQEADRIEATCTEDGTIYLECKTHTNCGVTDEVVIPKLGHTEELRYSAPSCTAEGSTSIYCDVCKQTLESKTLDKLDHTYEVESIVNSTCKVEGTISLKCKYCTETNTVAISVNSDAHSFKKVTDPATCTKAGSITVTCENGCDYKEETTLPMLQHSWGNWSVKTPSTNGAEGEMIRYCGSGCEETVKIPAGGHKFENAPISIKAATCTSEGEEIYKCSAHANCGVEVTVTLDKIQHTLKVEEKASSCIETGYAKVYCTVCNEVYTDMTFGMVAHNWDGGVVTPATCVAAGFTTFTCQNENCDATYDRFDAQPTGHKYETEGSSVKTAPTCTEMGYTTYTCDVCKVAYTTDFVKPTGHIYDDGVETKATCTSEGKIVYTCTVEGCGQKYEVTLAKLQHNYVEGEAVEATCTTSGYTPYSCTCGSNYVIITSVANGHNYQNVVSSTASCGKDGEITLKCTECDDTMTTDVTALGHNYVQIGSTPATCATAATETFKCSNCDAEYTVSVGTKTDAHDFGDWITVKEPSYTSIGYKTKTCKICEKLEVDIIDATGDHDLKEVKRDEPTCTEKGKIYYECKAHPNCGMKSEVEIPANGHTEKLIYAPADCTNAGYTKIVCTVDGCDYEADETTIPALGHAWDEEAITVKNATCSATGSISLECKNCDATDTVVIPENAEAHKLTIKTEPATCTTEGSVTVTCENGCTYEKVTPIPMLQHKWSEWKIEPSTYTEPGSMSRECSICKETVTVEIPAGGHAFNNTPDSDEEATCIKEGSATYKCSVHEDCGVEVTVILPVVHHELKTETVDATCTDGGSVRVYCENCTYESIIEIGKLAHDYEEIDKVAATCTTAGYTTFKCKSENCDATFNRFDAQPTGHTFNDTIEANVTIDEAECEKDGSKTVKCKDCDTTEVTVIPATGHKYETEGSSVTTAPTCTEMGYTTYTCDACKVAYTTNFVKPGGHDWGDWEVTKESTNTDKGEMTRTCKTDGKHVEKVEIPAGGHELDPMNPASTTYGTCQKDGYKDFECLAHRDCGVMITINTGRGAHNWSAWEIKNATNDADGYWKRNCLTEGCTEVETLLIPAGNHNLVESEYKAPKCNETGYRIYKCNAHENCSVKITVTLEKIQHTAGVDKKDATCTENGYVKTYCTVCGYVISNVELEKTGHIETRTEREESTCVEPGFEKVICKCGVLVSEKVLPLNPHNYDANKDGKLDFEDAVYTAPVQNADGTWTPGYYTFTCQTEGCTETKIEGDTTSYEVRFFDGNGVQIGETQIIPSGMSAIVPADVTPEKNADANYHYLFIGWDRDFSKIEKDLDVYATFEKEAHYGGEATCNAYAECEKCNEPYGEFDESKHVIVTKSQAATCEADGWVEYYCATEGCKYHYNTSNALKKETIGASGHVYGQWNVIQNGTCEIPQIQQRKCINYGCNKVEEKRTQFTHTWLIEPKINPTCTAVGYTEFKYCLTCNLQIDRVEISKIDHRDLDGNGYCDYCGTSKGAPKCSCMCHSTGIMKFFYRIVRFFWMITRSSPSCSCGAVHY